MSGLVVLLGGAIWLEYYRKWLPLLVIAAATVLLWVLPSSSVPPDPLAVLNLRIVQPNIGQEDKWRPGFDEEAARRLAQLLRPARRRAAAAALAGGCDHRSDPGQRAATHRHSPNSSASARRRRSVPMTGC